MVQPMRERLLACELTCASLSNSVERRHGNRNGAIRLIGPWGRTTNDMVMKLGSSLVDPCPHRVLDSCEYPSFCDLAHFLRHCSYACVSLCGHMRVSPEVAIVLRSKRKSQTLDQGKFAGFLQFFHEQVNSFRAWAFVRIVPFFVPILSCELLHIAHMMIMKTQVQQVNLKVNDACEMMLLLDSSPWGPWAQA